MWNITKYNSTKEVIVANSLFVVVFFIIYYLSFIFLLSSINICCYLLLLLLLLIDDIPFFERCTSIDVLIRGGMLELLNILRNITAFTRPEKQTFWTPGRCL